ncbi:DUF7544 domain-containing protein [Natrarchaeobaculum sulfurireducens]|uniref:Uncharacterized protein n=1 Tax=Natrarchaeobaculum sulfurireducens TaxID=2044521 RepID=A0A346PH55_9EURY|nr:hypothetical protein [Natrarchaeobaculum sulfurireducens]AXR78850.1 hypothetical protein AArc1_2535 [Natrarchaeobaculum sulfurireducens]
MDAVDDLGDAIDVTRDLLLPIRPWLWLKLAIVVLFVTGIGLGGGIPSDPGIVSETEELAPADPAADPAADPMAEPLPDEFFAIALALVLLAVLLWLFFAIVGAIMEFVFVESLRSNDVRIRRFSRENLGRGLRLFGFRLLVGLLSFAVLAVPAAAIVLTASGTEAILGSFLLLALVGIGVGLVYVIVMRFTSEFVAPIMLLESRGVLSGWRRFWPTLTGNWSEYLVYLLLVWILQLVVNIAAGFLILFALVLVAIPFVILLVLLVMLGEIGFLLAIPVVLLGVLVALLVVALIQMPIRTYFQYYALLLLGDTNRDLDLIPDQRAAARDDDERDGRDGPISAGREDHWEADESESDRRDDRDDEGAIWDDSDPWDDSSWDDSSDRESRNENDAGDWDVFDDDREANEDSDHDGDDEDGDDRDERRGW